MNEIESKIYFLKKENEMLKRTVAVQENQINTLNDEAVAFEEVQQEYRVHIGYASTLRREFIDRVMKLEENDFTEEALLGWGQKIREHQMWATTTIADNRKLEAKLEAIRNLCDDNFITLPVFKRRILEVLGDE